MKRILVALLAAVLALALCACGLTDWIGGLIGGGTGPSAAGGSSGTEARPLPQNVQSLMDYAKQLEEAGNPEAAAAAYEKLSEAAQADAQYAAAEIVEREFDMDLIRSVAKADLQGVRDDGESVAAVEFTDVSESDWYYDAVQWAAAKGVVSGETFSPGGSCTRAQALTFLWRAKGQPSHVMKSSPFTDVTEGLYYYEPVLWAFENGLLTAADDGLFHADDPVTRAMMVTFLYRAEGGDAAGAASPYSDVTGSEWFADAAVWAHAEGIVSLNDAKTFDPGGLCTRAHSINFLYRCYG